MLHHEDGEPRHKAWSKWSVGAKIGVIVAGIILVPSFLALFAAATMWLWNWLMPVIFKLPTIGFWQAVGLLILSHILFKGGHAKKMGRSRWKKERIREKMGDDEPEAKKESAVAARMQGAEERSMKAAIYTEYGPPDVVQIKDVEKPVPKDNEVLVEVRAASVNPYDRYLMRGLPYLVRLMAGLRKPKDTRLGTDVAGQVEAIGRNVTRFKPGDAVFGACKGAFAEHACPNEPALAMKPDNVTFEQAASVPIAALTALQGLRNKGKLQPGQKVLINGAAGGVGTFAVQIAKSFGADVTGVCSTRNVDMVRSIGADRAIDYTQEDFTRSGRRYDLIFDLVGNRSLSARRRVLTPNGICVTGGASAGRWMIGPLAGWIAGLVVSSFGSRKFVVIPAKMNKEDLTILGGLVASGKVTPVIDRRYKLSEIANAIGYLGEGHARGKVVITLE